MPSRDLCTIPHKSPSFHACYERAWNFHTRLMYSCRAWYCCILSQYRGAFNVSIGFGLGLLRWQEGLAWYVPSLRLDAWLAYRILCAGLLSVNYLGTRAHEYYCRVGEMVSRNWWPTLLTRSRERKESVTFRWYKSETFRWHPWFHNLCKTVHPSWSSFHWCICSVSVP